METQTEAKKTLKRVGIAADHGGFELKEFLVGKIRAAGFEVTDFGDAKLKSDDDYPDFIIPLARAVAVGAVDRGVGICGSGVGASIAANKVAGVRAGLIDENFSAHQGVEDDDLNMICFGGLLVGADTMQRAVQVPSSLIGALLGLVVLFVSGSAFWSRRWAAQRKISEMKGDEVQP